MVNCAGVPYTRRDFEIAQDKDLRLRFTPPI